MNTRGGIVLKFPDLSQAEVLAISKALADTEYGFTGSELEVLLKQYDFADENPTMTKYKRLYNSFVERYNREKSCNSIYMFIQKCMDPARGLVDEEKYAKRRMETNKILMLKGIEIDDGGNFRTVQKAQGVSDVTRRTRELRQKLYGYGAHQYVLQCCKEELLAEDYFQAVQETAKSLCDRVREMTGLPEDGNELIQTAFSNKNPYIAFNSLRTSSEQNQQNGLKEMILGIIHMVRNVTAHELRIRWDIDEAAAVEMLQQISFLHKYLDQCIVVKKYM